MEIIVVRDVRVRRTCDYSVIAGARLLVLCIIWSDIGL